tara:strand:+ start:57 stop:251 length:195 start_codon:yes stop_codon:yes gene_type:complete
MKKLLNRGDLVSLYDYKGRKNYAIIIDVEKRFDCYEIRIMYQSSIKSIIYNDLKSGITFLQGAI